VLQFVVSGVAIGAVYGLIGMALAITFYVTRIINFAQGQMMMATVMVTAEVRAAGYPTWAAALLGLGCACALGVLSYLIAVRPILALNRFSFGWLVSTLGFAVILENAAAYIWGRPRRLFRQCSRARAFTSWTRW
jgi:branched-chain amino acid transport system permease protein